MKPTVLWTNAPYALPMQALFRSKPFEASICRTLAAKGRWVTGNRYMQQSAAYPVEFCHMVLRSHDNWVSGLKKEFCLVLLLAVRPLLRLRLYPGEYRALEGLGEVELQIYSLLMV